jgi:signal transduction histidine kinase/ActR/RegA family two-component response regulator
MTMTGKNVEKAWEDILKNDALCEMEFRLKPKAEEAGERWVLARGRVERNGAGESLYAAGVVFDITEKKMNESALKDADRRKNEFLATLAHELRNPLAPIKNALHIIDMESAAPEVKARARQLMKHQVNHMERLVDDLMDVSRITQGKIELKRESINLSEAVQLAVDAARPLIEGKGLSVLMKDMDQDLWLYADNARLSQILSNVLNNAAKYTIEGGITVNVLKEGRQAVVAVKDTGIGIPEKKLSSIFDMFMQVDNSMEKSYGGLGIGLTLVRSLLSLHGGSITAESAGEGKGSTFTIRFPLSEKKSMPTHENTDKTAAPVKKHAVLIVDDNESSAKTLGWIFELMGHDYRVANTAEQAIEITKEYRPDLVLLDIGMPGMNGYDLCRHLRKDPALSATTFVAQTGWGQKEHRKLSEEAGFHHHLVKPVNMPTLNSLIQEIDRAQEAS